MMYGVGLLAAGTLVGGILAGTVSASAASRLINHEVHAPTAYTWSNGSADATRMPSQARKVTAVKISAYERVIHARCAATRC